VCARAHAAAVATPPPQWRAAQIYRHQEGSRQWQAGELLVGHNGVVHDVSWAPALGRSYHLIATACMDGRVRIYRIKPDATKDRVEPIATFQDHEAEVWKVEWNVTGTVLSSSGDDGKVRLWKGSSAGARRGHGCAGAAH